VIASGLDRRLARPGLVDRLRTPAALVTLVALAVAALALLPPLYLALRAAEAGPAALAVLARPSTWAALGRTLALALAVPLLSITLALPIAWLTTRTDLPARRLWFTAAVLPLAWPSYVSAYLYVAALGPRGLAQQALSRAGLFSEGLPAIYGFPGALLAVTAVTYPYVLLTVRAALLRIDPAQEAAARSLGLNPWRAFARVIWPQLRPAIAAGALLAAVYAVRDFGAVAIMRYDSFSPVIYVQYRSAFDRTGAAVLALMAAALGLALVSAERRMRPRGARYHPARARVAAAAPTLELGRWRTPALLWCAGVVGLSLLLPAGVLLWWLARGLAAGETIGAAALLRAAGHSALAAGLAAGATVLAAAPVALLRVRRPGLVSRWIERATWTGFALPGVAVALALVYFGIRVARPLYQTLPLLVLAYVLLFLPLAVGTSQAALRQVHPHLEQSARSLGRSPWSAFRAVTLPLATPGIAAAAVLVFLSAMKELPATLVLGPTGFRPLAVTVWSAVGEAYFARAAAPALLLVLLSSLPAALLTLRRTV
jgi:iron(III) transport system permease protein